MTDFETHPAGTADLVERLRECSSDEAMWSRQAADRIEQLEAALADKRSNLEHWRQEVGKLHSRVATLTDQLTRANAATAAAFEVAAEIYIKGDWPWHSDADDAIRALATSDQTAALDRLIAEAVGPYVEAMQYYETQFCEGFCEDMPDRSVTSASMENDCGGCKARAILAASKKGGV